MRTSIQISRQTVTHFYQSIIQNLHYFHLPQPVVIGLMALLTIALGIGLGSVMMTPAGLIIFSAVFVLFYLVIIAAAPLKGVALWLVLFAFTDKTVNISLGEGIPDLSPTRFVIAFLIAILLGQAATGQRRFPKITKLDIVSFLFILGIGVSASASSDPVGALQSILDRTIIPILAYYIVKNLIFDKKDLDLFFHALIIIAIYSSFFLFQEWITGNVLWYDGQSEVVHHTGIRIVRSLWGNPSVFGSIFAMVIPLTFYRIIKSNNGLWRAVYLILLGMFLIALGLTFKRGSWMSSLVSFVIIFPFFPSFRKLFLVIFAVIVVSLTVFGDELTSNDAVEAKVNNRVDTLNGRTYRWEVAIDLWKQKPIVGHGFNEFNKLSGFQAVESLYFHLLVSGGLLAFVPFIAIIVLTISESIQIYIRGPSIPNIVVDRDLIAVFWGMFSTYLVKGITGAQGTAIVNILFFLVIGAVVGSQGEQLAMYKEQIKRKVIPKSLST